jgi:DNA-3-methyladenine glycosylase II
MPMTFASQRPDVVSYADLAIRRGMRLLYGHREISRPIFQRHRRRYSPCASVVAPHLWEIAGG